VKSWYNVTRYYPSPVKADSRETVHSTFYVFAESKDHARVGSFDFPGEVDIRSATEAEVPVIQRGLTEATTEELKAQLQKRGWKVTLS
jgi:hypothetical protein